jgi:uncharacterized membrane protein
MNNTRSSQLNTFIDRQLYRFSRHWLFFFNVVIGIYVGLPFLAPVFQHWGMPAPANLIYTVYSPLCHQMAYRSWFLFGEQITYSPAELQTRVGIEPYTGSGRLQARAFTGNAQMGYKVAYCERDVAIYAGVLLTGLLFAMAVQLGQQPKPLHWLLYVLIGILPIALDGFSQLFSQPPFGWLVQRESTPLLRTLTGLLFGIANVALAYPYVLESMREVEADYRAKFGKQKV